MAPGFVQLFRQHRHLFGYFYLSGVHILLRSLLLQEDCLLVRQFRLDDAQFHIWNCLLPFSPDYGSQVRQLRNGVLSPTRGHLKRLQFSARSFFKNKEERNNKFLESIEKNFVKNGVKKQCPRKRTLINYL